MPIPVYRGSAPREDGYPVWVGQDVYNKRWLRILGVDYERAVNGGVTVSEVGPHSNSHLLSGSDPTYIDVRQVLNVLAYASTAMTVHVNAGWVIIDGQPVKIASTNIDMTASIPASGAAYSIIRADNTGTLSVVDGTPVESLLDLTDDDAPSFAGGYAAIALVRLWFGQTELSRSSTQPDVTPLYLAQNNDAPMAMLADMVEPTGFIDRTSSTIAFTDGTLTFEVAPTGTTFSFYSAGVKFTKTAQTKVIADTAGVHHIYFDTDGVLQESTDEWDINSANVPVAAVLWDGSAGLLMDERHGIQMDGQTQEYLHETRGSAFASGMAGTFAADGSTITIGAGEWYDEDIEYITTEKTQCRVFYLDSTVWKWSAAQNAYFTAVSSVPQYNNSGALADVGVAKYSISWVYMTNITTTPISVIMGQAEYNTQALAEAAGVPALSSLPAEEMILLYKVIWQRNGAVITWKRTDDYRRILGGPTADYIATDHGALAGLNDPDHPASAITVDTTNFDNNLSAADTTVQAALETLDDMIAGGSPDAADVTYTPSVLTDWDGDADPGNADAAFDQLAERVDDLEAGTGVTDADAIHDNVAGEIDAITAKVTPLGGDLAIIEDGADSYNKKSVDIAGWPLWGFRLYTAYGGGIYTGTLYFPQLYYDVGDDEIRWDLVVLDASYFGYTPAVLTDWDGDADPGNVDDALDQLAERIDDVEGAAGHAAVTLDADAAVLLDLSTQEIGLDVQNANKVFAGPTTGADNEPTFRALVAADVGTGTPTGSKYLRDDMSWQTVSASGGATVLEVQVFS